MNLIYLFSAIYNYKSISGPAFTTAIQTGNNSPNSVFDIEKIYKKSTKAYYKDMIDHYETQKANTPPLAPEQLIEKIAREYDVASTKGNGTAIESITLFDELPKAEQMRIIFANTTKTSPHPTKLNARELTEVSS